MALLLSVLIVSLLLIFLWWIITPRSNRKGLAPLPPGPPADPIIGHARIIPAQRPELTYMKLGKEYNTDIIYLEFLGKPAIILNSAEAATTLLEKRGAIYSNRSSLPFFEEQGWNTNFGFWSMGPQYRKHRKMVQNALTPSNCVSYREIQQEETHKLMRRILKTPDKWRPHFVTYTNTIIIRITYGIRTKEYDDPYVELATKVSHAVSNGGVPGSSMVDVFPIIRYLPKWLSIFPSLKVARDLNPYVRDLHDLTFAALKTNMADGVAETSFAKRMLEEKDEEKNISEAPINRITEDDINGASGAIFIAGQDTTAATIIIFILNMTLNPEVQEKAWKEIESVIGANRLPTFEDRDKLPYIECIMQETLRRNPVAPLGVPHTSEEDDIYKGYFIPKDLSSVNFNRSMVFGHIYAITRDEAFFKDPETFNPDRFLPVEKGGAGEQFPASIFGFGRRICPGRHLASASVWIVMATILATFKISKAKDEDGNEITPCPKFTTGITSHPEEFPTLFVPRSAKAVELLMNA